MMFEDFAIAVLVAAVAAAVWLLPTLTAHNDVEPGTVPHSTVR
jgi:hypothetical protein